MRPYVCIIHSMSKLLACDLDGTLFYPKQAGRCISRRNVKFLRRWIDAGNKLVLITSRSLEFVERLKKEIERPFDIMACTSAQTIYERELVRHIWMSNDELQKVLKHIDEKYKPLGFLLTAEGHPCVTYNTKRARLFFQIFYHLWYWGQFKYREPCENSNELFIDLMKNGKVYKVMTFFGFGKSKRTLSKEINKELRDNFPEIESSWSLIVNELTPKGCNKGEGLEHYCNVAKIPANDVYVIGDSGNDIAMFQKFHEHSYCMAHAYPSVKKYAKHTVSRVYSLDKLVLKGEK